PHVGKVGVEFGRQMYNIGRQASELPELFGALRKLLAVCLYKYNDDCVGCGRCMLSEPHLSDCPVMNAKKALTEYAKRAEEILP
ncbi:MAG: hypothetical protein KGJ13_13125, partial [Patescibacteria group bacterium]|nr:hypothetical protein [Patescibacteria group bacterium]